MKTILRFLIPVLTAVFSTHALASPMTEAQVAQRLCGLVQANPRYDYASIFDPEVAATYPESKVTLILQKYFQAHGACSRVSVRAGGDQVTNFELTFTDGYRGDLFLNVNARGLVNRILWGGALPPEATVTMRETHVRMRDGTELRTVVYQKNDGQRKPALIERTPYLEAAYGAVPYAAFYSGLASHYVEKGYAYVIQGIRGTGGSGGEFLFANPQEAEDGYDAIAWIASQDFSNGQVGALGGSYDGYTAMAAATANPPALKVVVASSYFTEMGSYGGNFKGVLALFNLRYLNYVARSQGTQLDLFGPPTADELAKLKSTPDLRKYDQLLYGVTIPEWQRIARNYPLPASSAFWRSRSILERLPLIRVPTYHLSGMLEPGDGDANDTVEAFKYLQAHGGLGGRHHLLVGFWTHPAIPQAVPVLKDRADRWFDHYLRGAPLAPEAAVEFASQPSADTTDFVKSASYPPAQFSSETLYLVDGELSRVAPMKASAVSFAMDPDSDNTNLIDGREVESSATQLVYSQTIDAPATFAGDMNLQLRLSVDAPQSDVIAALVKVDASGKLTTIGSTGSKILWRATPQMMRLDFGPLLTTFQPGEKLQVILTSNLFPQIVRNTNSGLAHYYDGFRASKITVESVGSSLTVLRKAEVSPAPPTVLRRRTPRILPFRLD